jgi:hypothetical protein
MVFLHRFLFIINGGVLDAQKVNPICYILIPLPLVLNLKFLLSLNKK